MKVLAVLLVMFILLGASVSQAQSDGFVAFTLNPAGQLQAYAMVGDTPGGDVEIWAEGQYVSSASIPPLSEGEFVYIGVVPFTVTQWEIRGAYSYVWENGGVYTPPLPTEAPPMTSLNAPQQPIFTTAVSQPIEQATRVIKRAITGVRSRNE